MRKKINLSFLFPLTLLSLLILSLSTSMFDLPPIGKFMNPFIGAVQNGSDAELDEDRYLSLQRKGGRPLNVYFDERKVPHIFAKNEQDLFFAQGYVTASMRLWQMDFLSYVAAGRLSEIFSDEAYLNYDRSQRRIGILHAAKASLEFIKKDRETYNALCHYTAGVNAYIQSLNYSTLPLEYKLLNYEPEKWTNLKSVILLKQMGNNLSGYEEDLAMTNLILSLGEKDFNLLYPNYHKHTTPVMQELVGELNPNLKNVLLPKHLNYGFMSSKTTMESPYNPKLGSNSWVVDGTKTSNGYPILCNDPHLTLTLPSIWMEMQLSCPTLNVYGVSIPGTPAVIIGYNQDIAWGITNGADDVKDWYKMKVKDDYSSYQIDGKWVKLKSRVEVILRKNQHPFYDTIYSSAHGPIVFDKTFPNINEGLENHSLRWKLYQPSNEFKSFIQLNKAHNYKDFQSAIKHYTCPSQNFTFAGKDNTIAIQHQGALSERNGGNGEFILDGSLGLHLSEKEIPFDSLPSTVNPKEHYLFSANQHPTSQNYPYNYYGYYFETRANQIHKLLQQTQTFNLQKMQRIQTDNTNMFAVEALKIMLPELETVNTTSEEKGFIQRLRTWKGCYTRNDQLAIFFDSWWKQLERITWDELDQYGFYSVYPENYVLLDLVESDPYHRFFDIKSTSKKEGALDLIYSSFQTALAQYQKLKKQGKEKWGLNNKISILHPTQKKALSFFEQPSSGHPSAINSISGSWGPSWRMIVQLGERPKGLGIYAGGQSGNSGSKYYSNFIADWMKERYYTLNFFLTEREAATKSSNKWHIN